MGNEFPTKFWIITLHEDVDINGVQSCVVEADSELEARRFVASIQHDRCWIDSADCIELGNPTGDTRIVIKSY